MLVNVVGTDEQALTDFALSADGSHLAARIDYIYGKSRANRLPNLPDMRSGKR